MASDWNYPVCRLNPNLWLRPAQFLLGMAETQQGEIPLETIIVWIVEQIFVHLPLTLTFPSPEPWLIKPSEAVSRSHKQTQSPTFCMTFEWISYIESKQTLVVTLFAYFAFILSSIACRLGFVKSRGLIWIRSETVTCTQR